MRCAKCRHSWFEAGPGAEAEPAPEAPAAPVPPTESTPVPPAPTTGGWDEAPAEPVSTPAPPTYPDTGYDTAPEPTFAQPDTPAEPMPGTPEPYAENAAGAEAWPEAPEFDRPDATPVAAAPEHVPAPPAPEMPAAAYEEGEWTEYEEEPARKSKLRLIVVILLVLAAVAAAAFFAVRHYGAPEWMPVGQVAFAPASEDLQLEFPVEEQDRRKLENGLQYFAASGTVTNTGRQTQYVPDVQVVLRDAQERVVYSWELEPPKRELAPGESLTINEAVTDVPASARVVEIGWKAS